MVLAPACLGDFNLKRGKKSAFKNLKYNLLRFLVMLVPVSKMRPPEGFNTSVSVFLLSVVVDWGIEKPGVWEGRTTEEMSCNFAWGLWVWGRKPKILNMKIPLGYLFGTSECSCSAHGYTWEFLLIGLNLRDSRVDKMSSPCWSLF